MTDIPNIQQEINEVGEVALRINQRLAVARAIIVTDPIAARTNIEIAIETCNHIKSRLHSVMEGIE